MSSLLALLANVNRDKKKSGPFSADDFNPYRNTQVETIESDVSALKVFVDGKLPAQARQKGIKDDR
jgi:hypothetical protein